MLNAKNNIPEIKLAFFITFSSRLNIDLNDKIYLQILDMASKYWHGCAFVRFHLFCTFTSLQIQYSDDSCAHSKHENGNLEHRKDLHKDLSKTEI